jgi:hypothetical protein
MSRRLAIAASLTLGACASEDPSAPASAPAPSTNPAPTPALAVDSIYAKFLPAQLCAMERRDLRGVFGDLVTAGYEKDDVKLHVNLGKVEDLEQGRGFYQRDYTRVVRGPWGIYTRAWTLDSGERTREACIIVRNAINACTSTSAMREPPDPAPCLLEIDLAGLVELAATSGAPSGLNDLDFTYSEQQWQEHEASLRPTYSEYARACKLHAQGKRDAAAAALAKAKRDDQPIDVACRMLEETRRDCERDAFDERLAETDFHLRPKERANFRRTWYITCKLAL